MTLKANMLEVRSVTSLSSEKRYQYFIKKVADTGLIWGLYKDGWAMAGDENNEVFIPLWPLKDYALICANQQWEDYKPESVDIHDFINDYLYELKENSIRIAIFYTFDDKGIIPSYEQLKNDLEDELSRIE